MGCRYDAYGKGYITPLDFRAALRDCGVTLSDGQAARLMPVYDRNRDQRVQVSGCVCFLCACVHVRAGAGGGRV